MASSGKVRRSTPEDLASSIAFRILRWLPAKSPTVVFICAIPMRSRRVPGHFVISGSASIYSIGRYLLSSYSVTWMR